VLSGAGCSTESGIPDYRGPGARRRNPVQYKAFVSSEAARARYWARSAVGWRRISQATPNAAHLALATLERHGLVTGIITQNVDGLHRRAGSQTVLELHGSLSRVRCLGCGHLESRANLQERLLTLNTGYAPRRSAAVVAPDGDAELELEHDAAFRIPACRVCDQMLKPDVVFFGENVPKSRVEEAWRLFHDADALLVVGSSLTVFSGYRFVLRAAQEGRPVAIVNRGWTRGDEHASLKLDGRLGLLLPSVVRQILPAGVAHS
jgi:NAD-dependent protein deacetylase/lipoamidase sirtuin 4